MQQLVRLVFSKMQQSSEKPTFFTANPKVFWFLNKLIFTQFYEGFLERVHSINAIISLLHQQPTISISDKIYFQSINFCAEVFLYIFTWIFKMHLSLSAIYDIWSWPFRLITRIAKKTNTESILFTLSSRFWDDLVLVILLIPARSKSKWLWTIACTRNAYVKRKLYTISKF